MTNLGTICSINRWNSEQNSPNLSIWEQNVPFTVGNSEQNSPNSSIWKQYVPFTNLGTVCSMHRWNSEQNSPKLPIWEQYVPFTVETSERNVLVLSRSERFVPNL